MLCPEEAVSYSENLVNILLKRTWIISSEFFKWL